MTTQEELIKKLLDSGGQRDPAEAKRLVLEMRRNVRRMLLRSVRVNGLVMFILGLALCAGGAVAAGLAILTPTSASSGGLVTAAGIALAMGAGFAVMGRLFGVPGPIKDGMAGMATVTSVVLGGSIGIQKPGVSASLTKVTLGLSVQPTEGASPFETRYREYVVASDLRYLKEGASVPVLVDRTRPRRVGIDWDQLGAE